MTLEKSAAKTPMSCALSIDNFGSAGTSPGDFYINFFFLYTKILYITIKIIA
jgi:hypothetical protein